MPSTGTETKSGSAIGPGQTVRVGAASLFSAASGFLVLFIAARALPPADNAEFLAFWAGLFAVIGILGGLTAETTRAVGARAGDGPAPDGTARGARVITASLIVGGALAALVLVVGLPLADRIFSTRGTAIVILLASAALVYSIHSAVAGSLQGRSLWGPFASLLTTEALIRLAAVGAAAATAGGLFGVEAACLAALLAWVGILAASKASRAAAMSRADVPLGRFLRQTGQALLSAGASAALLVSFPLLVKITTSPQDYDLAAPLLLAISLTRAPIMLPLQAFQGVAIAAVVRARGEGLRVLRKPVAVVTALGVAGSGLAAVAGPPIMLFFGPAYRVEGWVMAALTLASSAIALLTLTGTGLLALGRHRANAAGWVVATAAAVSCLLLPFSTEVRCVLALLAGPVPGIAVHLALLQRGQADCGVGGAR